MMNRSLLFATYNVLAQCFVEPERYAYLPPPLLDHTHRTKMLLDTIDDANASVLLLQEVEGSLLDRLRARLGSRYHILWSRRPTHTDGCAILVSRTEAQLLNHHTLIYQDHEPGYSQVACIATIRHKDQDLTVVSTHLRCGCQAIAGQSPIGQLQIRALLRFVQHQPTHACILGGDLNATPDSLTLKEAYTEGFQRTSDQVTAYIRGVLGKRDYLLYTGTVLCPLPSPRFEQLPSRQHPSDHVMLRAKVARSRMPFCGTNHPA